LAIKTVEQAIEASATLDGKHFHSQPRSAHGNRMQWIKEKYSSVSKDVDELWGAYGALGYEGVDVAIEVRGEETVISKPRIEEHLHRVLRPTSSPKLKE
jgi:hypothetical protein